MTLQTILNFARAQTQTDVNGLTDVNGIIFANEANADFHRRLIAKNVDASQIQETYTTATAATAGNGSTFLYPTDMLFLKAIEVNYTDTNQANYQMAQQVDVSNIAGQNSFGWLRANASAYAPQFDDRGDWYEIFPAFTTANNLTNAIRLFYYLKPTLYVATSDTIAYPENIDASILGWRIAASFLYSLGIERIPDGDKFLARYEERVLQYISTLSRGTQQPIQASPLQINGFEF
jgi:hypothetical protein